MNWTEIANGAISCEHGRCELAYRLIVSLLLLCSQAAFAQQSPVIQLGENHATVFSLFDGVDLYQKNGFVEIYGASLRQRKTGPISVNKTDFLVEEDRAVFSWAPDFSPASGSTHLSARLRTLPDGVAIKIGFLLNSGESYSFLHTPDTGQTKQPSLEISHLPEYLVKAVSTSTVADLQQLDAANLTFIARLSDELASSLNEADSASIRLWFVELIGAAGSSVSFEQVSLVGPRRPSASDKRLTLAGHIVGTKVSPETPIELVSESGQKQLAKVGENNSFEFSGLTPDGPVSIRFQHENQENYAERGRWFHAGVGQFDVVVNLSPPYVNKDGHAPDPSLAKFHASTTPKEFAAIYAPHTRQYWPGAGKVQEYDSTTFTNNFGFLDRDRFFDNPDNCYRVVQLGGSEAVALQVRAFEKYNIILESELGVLLGRCVEVISAGRDNGDIGGNYPRLDKYAVRFDPDVILISSAITFNNQIHPELLRKTLGWDAANNALDSFYYDEAGTLTFRPWSPAYPFFTVKTDYSELTKGVPLFWTGTVPFEDMHPIGLESWQYLSDIMAYIKEHHPTQNVWLQTGLDQMGCKSNPCSTVATIEGGKTIAMGVASFLENHRIFCKENQLVCLDPPIPHEIIEQGTYLTFKFDGHYSRRGHQWLAKQLAQHLNRQRALWLD